MKLALRLGVALSAAAFVAGCAGNSSGVGIDGRNLASIDPSERLGNGPLTPESLLGVAPSALLISLGAPAFKRSEPDAEVWQYGGTSCALFVYFYKAGNGELASTYVDARKTSGGPANTTGCLNEVMQRRQQTPVS